MLAWSARRGVQRKADEAQGRVMTPVHCGGRAAPWGLIPLVDVHNAFRTASTEVVMLFGGSRQFWRVETVMQQAV